MAERYFEVRLKVSGSGKPYELRRTLEGLGLTRFGRTVNLKDTPAVRGMLYKVVHMLDVTPKSGAVPPTSARARVRAAGKKGRAKKVAKAEAKA